MEDADAVGWVWRDIADQPGVLLWDENGAMAIGALMPSFMLEQPMAVPSVRPYGIWRELNVDPVYMKFALR